MDRFPESNTLYERTYAGVLGKIIGVYLGRPFEMWSHERILRELGEIEGYVHDRLGVPLVVTDDDISGTFTFLRALEDFADESRLSSAHIGQTWLNYIIENRTILWWGGMGTSTEHTAFLRLKSGVSAPESGSMGRNGQTVAEQIGAQIFIDGWGMVCPGDPRSAATLAREAARVSHDGEAVYAAQLIAAMIAEAYVESEINRILDVGLSVIPSTCLIAKLIDDLRTWHATGEDWKSGFEKIKEKYGTDRFGGGCHIVPNHALVIHAILHGQGDFSESMKIVNSLGWDTDCNSGNVGCLLGVRNGLKAFEGGFDWRGPVSDRMYLPTADGGRAITDALTESVRIVNLALTRVGRAAMRSKDAPRFHFSQPGSVQGFRTEYVHESPALIENPDGCGLLIEFSDRTVVETPTFLDPESTAMPGYAIVASPTLYPGQTLRAQVKAKASNPGPITLAISTTAFPSSSERQTLSDPFLVEPGESTSLEWTLPFQDEIPISRVGIMARSNSDKADRHTFRLESFTWDGIPNTRLGNDHEAKKTWVDNVSWFDSGQVVQNEGTGTLTCGCEDWKDLEVSCLISPKMGDRFGLMTRVCGLRRWVALVATKDRIQFIQCLGDEEVLSECPFDWPKEEEKSIQVTLEGSKVRGWIDGRCVLEATVSQRLRSGGVGILLTAGRLSFREFYVRPPSHLARPSVTQT